MKCFYHKSDLDGHCSGALIKLKNPECEMIGVDYADYVRDFKVQMGETVYVVDFRFPMDEMVWLSAFAKLHWIDHHKTSIDEAHEAGFLASGGQYLEIGEEYYKVTGLFEGSWIEFKTCQVCQNIRSEAMSELGYPIEFECLYELTGFEFEYAAT